MDLKQQVQVLIDEAPEDGQTPQAMRAIAPMLISIAQQFRHLSYYVLHNLNQQLQTVTLQNRSNPQLEKTVIYAYDTLKSATQAGQDPDLIAAPVALTHLLFQLISLPEVDSLIFLETKQGQAHSLEVHRTELQQLLQQHLQLAYPQPGATDTDDTSAYLA